MIAQMVVYLGSKRETEILVDVEILACGAGRIACPECEGTGNWGPFHPEPLEWEDCVVCKGTGKWLVAV